MTYHEQLLDQRWQRKRLELLEKASWRCQSRNCSNNSENPTLHIHHLIYIPRTKVWDYEDWAYAVLCDECHKIEQTFMSASHAMVAQSKELRVLCYYMSLMAIEERSEIAQKILELARHINSNRGKYFPMLDFSNP